MNNEKSKLSDQLRHAIQLKHYSYQHDLGIIDAMRALHSKRLPVVLTQEETSRLMPFLNETASIMVRLLYGSGLRLMECHRLRVKDIDFLANQIIVRDGKEFKDRVTVLLESIITDLRQHLITVKALHEHFGKQGFREVELPYAT
jgi:integrase